jgi:hypothetical protein
MQTNWQALKRVKTHGSIVKDMSAVFGPAKYDFRVKHINGEKVLEFKLINERWK